VYNGNTVYTIMTDYQKRDNGGDGWLRILEFSPANDEILVKTYSPTLDLYETDADSQFVLSYDMGPFYEGVWVYLGSVDDEQGLNRPAVEPADGSSEAYAIGGRNCRKNVDPNSDYYMYFQIDDSYALEGSRTEVYITCKYYDAGSGSIRLEYDGIGGAYTQAASVSIGGTGTWQSYSWQVTDGYFGGRQNGNSDFRIYRTTGQTMYLYKIEVANQPPGLIPPEAIVDANPMVGRMPLEVNFDGSGSYDDNGTIVAYEWDFDNDGTIDATGVTAVHVYGMAGDYTAELTVTDDDNLVDTVTVHISVEGIPGDFDFDLDVDQEDFGHLQFCMTGSGFPQNDPNCQDAKLDTDEDVDSTDFGLFQACMRGANNPPGC
ncbi:MAG: PKD domain-containing protein, partial [Planctomycetota bacterium]